MLISSKAASLVRDGLPGLVPNFRVITLREPLKQEMLPFLEREHRGEVHLARPARVARVQVTVRSFASPSELVELLVDLDAGAITKKEHLVGKHSYVDAAYMQAVEDACRADSRVQEQLRELMLPAGAQVVIEPWAYATDGMNDTRERTSMVSTTPFQDLQPQ